MHGAAHPEHRPHQHDTGAQRPVHADARQPGATAARQPHQQRFGLIIGVVRGEQHADAGGGTGVAEQGITGGAGFGLQIGGGFGTGPVQHPVRDAARGAQGRDERRFGSSFGAQAMVDGQRQHPAGEGGVR